GLPRYTGDIDFLVKPTTENARKLVAALDEFGFGTLDQLLESLASEGNVIQLGQPPNRIDLLTSISGLDYDEVQATGVDGDLDGIPVRFIGREALLKNKRSTGRLKDAADAEDLSKNEP
ncbi:MAG TPA: hypothetical protein VM534_07735, partial [Thermoanaerobaculia bacterium]|nr:hypothetical protein [Thermoanaerobaculia bacterium]